MKKMIKEKLFKEKSNNPIEIFVSIVDNKDIPMHGPIHHFIDGAVLLTAIHNANISFDLAAALDELYNRAETMPGATCGKWGICGSAASIGAALSILHGTGPLSNDENYKKHMELVSKILYNISEVGGPRCCKRNAMIALGTTIKYLKEKYGIDLMESETSCRFSQNNEQCIGKNCPFNK